MLFSCLMLNAQMENTVEWSYSVKENTIEFVAKIESGWHMYGMNIADGGPIKTSFRYENLKGVSVNGHVTSNSKLFSAYDETFQMDLSWYENEAVFIQPISIKSEKYSLDVIIEYMTCSDMMCMPYKKVFTIEGIAPKTIVASTPTVEKTNTEKEISVEEGLENEVEKVVEKDSISAENLAKPYWFSVIDKIKPFESSSNSEPTKSLWWIFLSGLIGGFIALLTPCVWPIIPMTVSFFLKRNASNRKKGVGEAFIYGLSIILIYVLLGAIITLLWGPSKLNDISTNAFFNVVLFLILVLFGISLLGAFELVLPSSWTNKVDTLADKTTGLVSIFFMASTLVLVSFSCTGPIIGTLLVDLASSKSLAAPLLGMFGFSLALSIPFSFFALFPSWLNSLPKSGSWMQTIKITLGVLELAFSLKFLSVADMAYGWGILSRDIFLLIWIVLFMGLAIYLFIAKGKYNPQFTFLRMIISMASLVFSVYMIFGLLGKPLNAISAFLPPMETQHWKLYNYEVNTDFEDYDKAMAFAQTSPKPIFVAFTGYGCVNCRRMEESIWLDDEIYYLLNKEFIMVKLYVDDKTELTERIEIKENGEKVILETVGDKWSYLQRTKFGASAQPYYVILDSNGNPKTGYFQFTRNVKDFKKFLESGL